MAPPSLCPIPTLDVRGEASTLFEENIGPILGTMYTLSLSRHTTTLLSEVLTASCYRCETKTQRDVVSCPGHTELEDQDLPKFCTLCTLLF